MLNNRYNMVAQKWSKNKLLFACSVDKARKNLFVINFYCAYYQPLSSKSFIVSTWLHFSAIPR